LRLGQGLDFYSARIQDDFIRIGAMKIHWSVMSSPPNDLCPPGADPLSGEPSTDGAMTIGAWA